MTQPLSTAQRIRSIDLLRGLVIVIMALDHTRDYWSSTAFNPADPAQTNMVLFLTRWITHFCAPVFVLLAGTSAYLSAFHRETSKPAQSLFLLKRGLWLVFLEIAVISLFWQFSYNSIILQVIWAIGIAMIVLAGLVFLPRWAILTFGLLMIFGHNVLDAIPFDLAANWNPAGQANMTLADHLWQILHVQGFWAIGAPSNPYVLFLGYPLIPWVGVMALGYGMGPIFTMAPQQRARILLAVGLSAVALFVVLRGFNIYGDPSPWSIQERGTMMSIASFLNTTKYPPSLLYLLMTLGPALALMPLLERWQGAISGVFTSFGKVPFLFYVAHIPLIHAGALVWQTMAYGARMTNPFDPSTLPLGYEPNLLRCYAVWAVVVFILYWPCKWFADLKMRRKDWWLSYL